jgi:bifunctional DNA-binding transcriptional regulator/antitoxin component of YhaV-PrlF toxin-antitoxin module
MWAGKHFYFDKRRRPGSVIKNFGPYPRSVLSNVFHIDHRSRHGMKTRKTARLSPKFQLTIPQSVRIKHGWKAGQEFALLSRSGNVMLVPVPTVEQLAGMFEGANTENYRDRDDH